MSTTISNGFSATWKRINLHLVSLALGVSLGAGLILMAGAGLDSGDGASRATAALNRISPSYISMEDYDAIGVTHDRPQDRISPSYISTEDYESIGVIHVTPQTKDAAP